MNKFRRIGGDEEVLAGVCGGLAYCLELPAWLIRTLWALSILCFGTGVFLYIILALFMPKWRVIPSDYQKICG